MAGYNPWKKKLVCLDWLHSLGKGVDLIGDNLQVERFHIPGHQGLNLFPSELNIIVLGCLHEQEGEIIARVQSLFLGSLNEAVEQAGSIGTIVAALDIDADTLFDLKYEISYVRSREL